MVETASEYCEICGSRISWIRSVSAAVAAAETVGVEEPATTLVSVATMMESSWS